MCEHPSEAKVWDPCMPIFENLWEDTRRYSYYVWPHPNDSLLIESLSPFPALLSVSQKNSASCQPDICIIYLGLERYLIAEAVQIQKEYSCESAIV